MGKALEKEFWHEIATFYNPNLKNMPGPYFRGYGMDMRKYFAITGIWIALALDNQKHAPLPPKIGQKYGEMSNLAPIFNLGLAIPKDDLNKLKKFSKPQFITRDVPNSYKGDSIKKATAMINKDWMMGGLWGNKRAWEQIKSGTIHWKTANDDVAWLMVLGDGKTNVKVSKTQMSIFASNLDANSFEVYIYAQTIDHTALSDKVWTLPGMNLNLKTTLKILKTERVSESNILNNKYAVSDNIPFLTKVVFEIPSNWNLDIPLLEIIPKKINE